MKKKKNSLYFDLERLFKSLKLKKDKVIALQTRLFEVCIFYKLSPNEVCATLIDVLNTICKDKTILLPAFSNDIIKFKKFDIERSLPNTGMFPKYCLNLKKFRRSIYPLHSFLISGPKTKEVIKLKQITTWGKGGIFEWLEINNAKWIAINLKWKNGCAFGHRAEELTQVPYRHYKTYEGKFFKKGKFIKIISEKKYSNYLEAKIKFDYSIFDKVMRHDEIFCYLNKSLYARSCSTKTITKNLVSLFFKDPFAFVKNKNYVKRWLSKNIKKQ